MNGKQFVVSTLFALVLLIVTLIPISTQQQVGTYDPWLDYNEDGKIDIKDIAATAKAFGALGDPTKIVYTKRLTYSWSVNFNVPAHSSLDLYNTTRGYERVSLYFLLEGPFTDQITVSIISYLNASQAATLDIFGVGGPNPRNLLKTYQVQGDVMYIWLGNSMGVPVTVQVGVYMTT